MTCEECGKPFKTAARSWYENGNGNRYGPFHARCFQRWINRR